jgi:ribonucleoside-triphosphate reductase
MIPTKQMPPTPSAPASTTDKVLPTLYQEQIHASKYARWDDNKERREYWPETVDRYLSFIFDQAANHGYTFGQQDRDELRSAILNLEVMPSMRAMMTAGPALERDNVAGYNCAYLTVSRPEAFDEAMYILMCGTGVGFSVERKYTNQLPIVPRLGEVEHVVEVEDSKIGWATALRELISHLYHGRIPKWDVSRVRPEGARLKTFGGRASGPAPLVALFEYVVATFRNAQGRQLSSRDCHGIMCKVGDIVVVGGVRRSALISLSDPDDADMREAKSGAWWEEHPEYALANNSAAWDGRPSREVFDAEWDALVASQSGERGIVNRQGLQQLAARTGRRDPNHEFGTNPCAEIVLRDREFCNLSEVVVRSDDTIEELARKVRLATILGTVQSTFTDFRYLSDKWKENCEEERLLGVSLTGIMDHAVLNGRAKWDTPLDDTLKYMREVAIDTNSYYAEQMGIPASASITCVKPSGTVSQLVDSASGIHPRFSRYYVRRNRMNKTDPVAQLLAMSGIPYEDEKFHPDTTWVFSYPMKAPDEAVTVADIPALQQLELWLAYADAWCEHKPSITVYVQNDEWQRVGDFVYENFDRMSGVSFLPVTEHTYEQAPYEQIDREAYEELLGQMPDKVYWHVLKELELADGTTSSQELACMGGACDIL